MNFNRLTTLHCLLLWLLIITVSIPAPAKERLGETVLTRVRPELVPLGITLNGSRAYAKIRYANSVDDNVRATASSSKTDLISVISPELSIASDWRNHALDVSASLELGRNYSLSSEDYNDWKISSNGLLDIRHNIFLYFGGDIGRYHVPRTSPNEANGVSLTKYGEATIFGRYFHKFGNFKLTLKNKFKRKDFKDTLGLRNDTLVVIDQDKRDRNEYISELRIGYKILPSFEAFTSVKGNMRTYKELQDNNFDRSSRGYEITIGTDFNLTKPYSGKIFANYLAQSYNTPLTDISAPGFGTAVYWSVTPLTTIAVSLQRSIEETTSTDFAGYTSTNSLLSVDHELRRDLLLKTSLNYIYNDYKGITDATQKNPIFSTLFKLTYMVNRYFYGSIQYNYIQSESYSNNATATRSNKYRKNVISIQLQTQL